MGWPRRRSDVPVRHLSGYGVSIGKAVDQGGPVLCHNMIGLILFAVYAQVVLWRLAL